jgi:RHS repeat-associated protein
VENPFRFPGQYYDQETVLHYNYFRYYNPQTGRYMTPDPIGLEGGVNPFAYVANDPANWIDPYGLLTKPVPGPIRLPDEGAPMGSYYGSRRAKTSPTGVVLYYYPHRGVDYLAPAGADVVAPISGSLDPYGTEGAMICRRSGTICCNGVERPRMICWKMVHINLTVGKGYIGEGKKIGNILPQNYPIPPHVDVEYYETMCIDGKARDIRQDPTTQFDLFAY